MDWIHLTDVLQWIQVLILLLVCFLLYQRSLRKMVRLQGIVCAYRKNVKPFSLPLKYILYHITKTRLYNFDPLKPHFYIVELGFIGVYIIFLISAQNINCGYSLEPPQRGGSNVYPQSMFWAEIWKISEFFIWKFSVFGDEIFYIFE